MRFITLPEQSLSKYLKSPCYMWRQEPYNLTEKRHGHTSWSLNNGSVVLLGGRDSENTTETVTPGVGTARGFNLKYPSR